jgi:hypothetical protein
MGLLFSGIISFIFILKISRLKNIYFYFILLIPFLPRYIGFGIGGDALSLKRVFLMLLFILTTVFLIRNTKLLRDFYKIYKRNLLLLNSIFLFILIKIISEVLNSTGMKPLLMISNDFLFSIFILFITILSIKNDYDIYKIYKIMFLNFIIIVVIASIEFVVSHPIYTVFASGNIESLKDINSIVMRGEQYRVSGNFVNTLILGQFLVVTFPLVIKYLQALNFKVILIPLFIFLFFSVVYMTDSRSAWLMIVLMMYLYIIISFYNKKILYGRLIYVVNIFLFLGVSYFSFTIISELVTSFSGFSSQNSAEENSLLSRSIQVVRIFDSTRHSMFFGNGRIVDFALFGQEIGAIDSYFLLVFYETGVIGLSIYLFFLFMIIKLITNLYIKKIIDKSLVISLILLIVYQFFISIPDNLIYIFIFLGIVLRAEDNWIKKQNVNHLL